MKNNPNYTATQREAYLKTSKASDREIILHIFTVNPTEQYNDNDIQHILSAEFNRFKPMRTVTARLNDLQRTHKIKISKIEGGRQYYSLRLKDDPLNKFKMTWKEKFVEMEEMVLYARNEKKYKNITTKSLLLAIKNLKDK